MRRNGRVDLNWTLTFSETVKTCPTCHTQYDDETLRFCLDDGSPLAAETAASGPAATLVMPGAEIPSTIRATQPAAPAQPTLTSFGSAPMAGAVPPALGRPYQTEPRRSNAILWVVGALIIGVAAIAVALILTRNRGQNNQTTAVVPAATPKAAETVATSPADVNEAKSDNTPQALNQTTKEKESSATPKSRPADKPESSRTPEPKRGPVAGGVMNGKAVRLVQPTYPAIARSAHASGTVTVQVLIDEEGNVTSAHAVSGHPLLQQSAVSAARASKFTPTKLNGQPVKVRGVIVYNFVAQ